MPCVPRGHRLLEPVNIETNIECALIIMFPVTQFMPQLIFDRAVIPAIQIVCEWMLLDRNGKDTI